MIIKISILHDEIGSGFDQFFYSPEQYLIARNDMDPTRSGSVAKPSSLISVKRASESMLLIK